MAFSHALVVAQLVEAEILALTEPEAMSTVLFISKCELFFKLASENPALLGGLEAGAWTSVEEWFRHYGSTSEDDGSQRRY